jgi:hypothetical protein
VTRSGYSWKKIEKIVKNLALSNLIDATVRRNANVGPDHMLMVITLRYRRSRADEIDLEKLKCRVHQIRNY